MLQGVALASSGEGQMVDSLFLPVYLKPPAPLGLDTMLQTWPRLHLCTFPLIALYLGVQVRVHQVYLLPVASHWPNCDSQT